jgi:hypothetical protein
MRQDDHSLFNRAAHRIAQLRNHRRDEPLHLIGRISFTRPAIEIQAAEIALPQTIAEIHKDIRREVLVAFYEGRQAALQVGSDVGERRRIRRFDRLLDAELLREIGFGNEQRHESLNLEREKVPPLFLKPRPRSSASHSVLH